MMEVNGGESGEHELPPKSQQAGTPPNVLKKIFVDENGKPMKFNVPPNKPSGYINTMKHLGGVLDMEASANSVIFLAPPGWLVPKNATVDYYSYEFIKHCHLAGRLLDKAPYLVPPGTAGPDPDGPLEDAAENTGPDSPKTSASSHSTRSHRRGRTKFSREEDLAILHFVYKGNVSKMVGDFKRIPNKEWEDAAARGVFGQHSGDTVRTRYQKLLILDIDKYRVMYEKWLDKKAADKEKQQQCPAIEEAIEVADSAEERTQTAVAAGSLGDGVDLPSQSQIGPAITSQATKKPLLSSTPVVVPPPPVKTSAVALPSVAKSQTSPGVPIFHADVVGVIPVDDEYDDESSSSSASAAARPTSNRRKSVDVAIEKNMTFSPKRSRKIEPENRAKSANADLSVNLKGVALAEFVSTADNLDEEFTQTIIPKTAAAAPSTKAVDKIRKDDTMVVDGNESSAAVVATVSMGDEIVRITKITSYFPLKAKEEAPRQSDRVEETTGYRLIEALAGRYGISPLNIVDVLRIVGGSFAEAIRYIEKGPSTSGSISKEK